MMTDSQDYQPTTAMGLITGAKEMSVAAEILLDSGSPKVLQPTYYLAAHAIELALKSFLLANGDSLDRLRTRIRHNLTKAARRVVAAKCEPISQIVADHFAEIDLLNVYYQAKELEYRVTGYKQYPPLEILLSFLQNLIPMIEPHARNAYPDR